METIICNTPSDIIQRTTLVEIIPAEKSNFTFSRVFKNQPLETNNVENVLKIYTLPEDCSLTIKQELSRAGTHCLINSNLSVLPHDTLTWDKLDFYMGRWVVMVLHTNTEVYFLGTQEQPLFCLLQSSIDPKESGSEGFLISIEGKTYTKPLRVIPKKRLLEVNYYALAFQNSVAMSL
jgi:hypothetical protein